jgi:type IV pilus assembly protein PilM
LSQNLKMPITRVDSFRGLRGPGIVDAPAFQENMLAFAVCYGLCLQGLGESAIGTNLIPREMLVDRMISAKKPWAAGAMAALAAGLTVSFAGYWHATLSVREEPFKAAEAAVNAEIANWTREKQDYDTKVQAFKQSSQIGDHLVLAREKMLRWSRLHRAIDACTPREPPRDAGDTRPPVEFRRRNEIFITSVTSERQDLAMWYTLATLPPEAARPAGPDGQQAPMPAQPAAAPPQGGALDAANANAITPRTDGPQGQGFVIRIEGYHFHNISINDGGKAADQGAEFLRQTFLAKLELPEVPVLKPDGQPHVDPDTKEPLVVPVKKLGIAFPLIVSANEPDWGNKVPNPFHNPDAKFKDPKDAARFNPETVVRYDFVVEFAYLEKPMPEATPEGADGAPSDQPGDAKSPNFVAQRP